MKRLLAVLLLIFTFGALSAYAGDEIDFDAVVYVGTGEGIVNGKGETPETAYETLDKAFSQLHGKEKINIVLVGNTVFENDMKISKEYIRINGNGVIIPKLKRKASAIKTEDDVSHMFIIEKGAVLELGGKDSNIIIDGCAYKSEYEFESEQYKGYKFEAGKYRGPEDSYIKNLGTLILNDGVAIQNIEVVKSNNKRAIAISNGGTVEMKGGIISECGPAYAVANGINAVFNFNGGKITGGKSVGAVYNNGEFNLNGGEISGIKEGIFNEGTLNLNSGKIMLDKDRIAIKGEGTYTKSDEVIIQGKVRDKDYKLVAEEETPAPEATAEPVPETTPEPELEAPDNNDTVPVYVDRKKIKFTDAYPFIDNSGRTQLPVRAVADMLGCEVSWDGVNKLVTLKKDGTVVKLVIGKNEITVNDNTVTMDTEAKIESDRTYIPGRYIGEAFGYSVDWLDGCVFINSLK